MSSEIQILHQLPPGNGGFGSGPTAVGAGESCREHLVLGEFSGTFAALTS